MKILPSEEEKWKKYYLQDKKNNNKMDIVYNTIYDNNINYKHDIALEYFANHISFANFFKNVEKTAKSFTEYGIKKGNFVTVCCAGIPEIAYTFYALSKIGAVSNMIAPYFDKNNLINRISDCESDILIVMDIFYSELKECIKKSRIKTIIIIPTLNSALIKKASCYKREKNSNELYWDNFIRDGKHNHNNNNYINYEENLPLAMVYSSGTTGASKGILLSNESFQNSVFSYPECGVDISRNQKFYQLIPPWYSTGLSTSLHLPLTYGCTVFMDPRFERNIFVKNIIKHKPNYTVAATSMYEGFLEKKLVGKHDLSFYNYPFEGGEPLRKEVADKIEEVFKEHGCNSKLRVAYGQCECGAAITTQTQKMDATFGSVGIPLPGIRVGIFDDENNELSYNKRGNIYAATPCAMIGYYKNEEENKKHFYVDKNGIKWSKTGDIGYLNNNGELFVFGRANDYSIINNKKIFNFDVENIILSFNQIKNCDVFEKNGILVMHLIPDKNYNKEELTRLIKQIQKSIFEVFKDLDYVPFVFKIRDTFPCAKSGKRDLIKLKSENEGFFTINNDKIENYTIKDNKKELKKILKIKEVKYEE